MELRFITREALKDIRKQLFIVAATNNSAREAHARAIAEARETIDRLLEQEETIAAKQEPEKLQGWARELYEEIKRLYAFANIRPPESLAHKKESLRRAAEGAYELARYFYDASCYWHEVQQTHMPVSILRERAFSGASALPAEFSERMFDCVKVKLALKHLDNQKYWLGVDYKRNDAGADARYRFEKYYQLELVVEYLRGALLEEIKSVGPVIEPFSTGLEPPAAFKWFEPDFPPMPSPYDNRQEIDSLKKRLGLLEKFVKENGSRLDRHEQQIAKMRGKMHAAAHDLNKA